MTASEIVPGVYVVKGKFAGEFGFISSYIVADGGEALIIDPGTAGDPGEELLEALDRMGLKKNALVGVLCTHGHPDHVGGAYRLKRATGARVMIHGADAGILENPQLFVNERLSLDAAGRFAMRLERGPLRVNYRGMKPDSLLVDGQSIQVGSVELRTIHTGGHSAGHCAFFDSDRKILFSGDEVNNFPNDPRKFYVDLSGSLSAKLSALEQLSTLGAEYLLPAHDIAHITEDVDLQFEEAKDSVVQFQDVIIGCVRARGEADLRQIELDIREARSLPYPTSLEALLPTTIQAALTNLEKAGLLRSERSVWKPI